MRQDEKLLKEFQGSFKRQVDEFRKGIRVFKLFALGTGWIVAVIAINLVVWYTIIFYIVIPALGKLQEVGIIPTF